MSPIPRSAAELDRIREAESRIQEKLRRDFKPEANTTAPMAYFEVSRYVTGNFKGMFQVAQMVTDDGHGKELKKPIRKVIADGVDFHVAISSLETALRRRVYR
jgi:hypothetical protein